MVFERSSPSCYSCEPFTALVNQSRGGIVLAGFAGEAACLSTLSMRSTQSQVTYLCDASASHALDDVSADEIHRAVSKISGLMERCMKRPIGLPRLYLASSVSEKNAGG